MTDHRKRLDRLTVVWPVPASKPRFDPSRLTPEELAEVMQLAPLVERFEDGTWDFSRATEEQLDRLTVLVIRGLRPAWAPPSLAVGR